MLSAKLIWLVLAIGRPLIAFEPSTLATPQEFHWNWKDWQELQADQSLRKAKLSQRQKDAILRAIAHQLRPMMSDLDIKSEDQLRKVALDTRIRMIDLDHDGIPEVVAQGMVNCSATGNCPFWVFRRFRRGYRFLLEGEAQTFTIQPSLTNKFHDIVLSVHGSASESGLTDYRYIDGTYHDVGCYDASWTILEGDEVRDLKEPRITPCR